VPQKNLDSPGALYTGGWKNMKYNSFEIRVILRVLLLTVFLVFGLYTWFTSDLYLTPTFLLFLAVLVLVNLLHFVRKSNREILHFLESIQNRDFSIQYSTGKTSNFPDLHTGFNAILNQFSEMYGTREEQYHYLQNIIQHVWTGLICITSDGSVDLVNRSALKLLNLHSLKHTSELENKFPELAAVISKTQSGQKSQLRLYTDEQMLQLLIHVKEFRIGNRLYKLISLENIDIELDEKEQKAWQDLIRVLMHEMMNSIAPITSLSSSISSILNRNKHFSGSIPEYTTLSEAAVTISRRGEHLMQFVENYRELTKLPNPSLQLVILSELFDRIAPLYRHKADERHVKLTFETEPSRLRVSCDPALMEQVIINLIDNAFAAVEETTDPVITVKAFLKSSTIVISIIDNGRGIPDELHEKVFIPFFTTRENGNGIGLSLSRQIVRAHRGTLNIFSANEEGTELRIQLKE
jgi:two-component system, NtrC family, nitrogen regulation sensor histidine kinase NtrY